jgi:type II restriction enzyme
MKYSRLFASLLSCSSSAQVFDFLMENLTDSIKDWKYFVDWEKVVGNVRGFQNDLAELNALVGQQDMENQSKSLLRRRPSLLRLIPALVGWRDLNVDVLTAQQGAGLDCESFDFNPRATLSAEDIDKAYRFANESGLLDLFRKGQLRSAQDYLLGVEVGLDSNGRKNRGGTAMEAIVASLLQSICREHNLNFITQASSAEIRSRLGKTVRVDKANRRFDFAVTSQEKLYLMETNFYGGGGSKLKATAGEYRALFDELKSQGHGFIWITDGPGWQSTRAPLEETFNHVDYVLNLKMVQRGVLTQILVNGL